MRNYLMSGFALVLVALFAIPRPAPPGTRSAGERTQNGESKQSDKTSQPGKPGTVPQIAGAKQIYSSQDVCTEAKYELHQKLREFGLDFSEPGVSGNTNAAKATAAQPNMLPSDTPMVESMIALVPDPVYTHLALRFDRYVDVMQQALQDSTSENAPGWLYVSQWLPWSPVPYQMPQDPVDRTNLHNFGIDRECAPGILIFRRNQYQNSKVGEKFLIVFLVGESPTSGILHEKQFTYAVQSWHSLQQRTAAQKEKECKKDKQPATRDPDQTLRILGPSFSASLPTLDKLLGNAKICPKDTNGQACIKAQVVSGSVSTSRDIIEKSGNFTNLKAAQFISLMESEDAIQKMLLRYFCIREHLPPGQVAFVSEDETAYGNLSSGTSESTSGRPLLFHYPREISQLRNAYEKNSIFNRQSGQAGATQNQQDLTLDLEDRHEAEDSVPSFSETQSPISEESILSGMTRAIGRAGVRVAVVNGSDVLDVIFVARYFSRNLPNVRVVLVNADLLFERSPDVSDFRGMLIANTYPLIPDNAFWTGRFLHMPAGDSTGEETQDHRGPFGSFLPERIFTSFDSIATYNATRLLECVPLDLHEDGRPSATPDCASRMIQNTGQSKSVDASTLWLAGYTDPLQGGNHPPFWLNAIGRGGFWPVDLLDRDSPVPGSETTTSLVDIAAGNIGNQDLIPPGMFASWTNPDIAAGGRLLLVCILALSVLFFVTVCAFARLDWGPEYVFDIAYTHRKRRAWLVLVIILCQSWIARLLILDLPACKFLADPVNCGLLLLELVLLVFAAWIIRKALSVRPRPFWAWLIILLVFLSEVAFHFVQPSDSAARVFYLYRSQHPFSGVCPVLPYILLVVALIGLLFRHIHSLLIFSSLIKPRMPSYGDAGSPPMLRFVTAGNVKEILLACYSPWRLLYSKLRHAYSATDSAPAGTAAVAHSKSANQTPQANPKLLGRLLIVTALMLLAASATLFPHGLETFETWAHAFWLTVFTFTIVVLMLLEIAWVVLIWVCLQNGLLTPLERTTLRACFNRVSGFSWHRLWFSIDLSPAVRFKPLSRAYDSMQRILRDDYCPGEVKVDLKEASVKHDEMLAIQNPGERVAAFSAYQDLLCKCATRVIEAILSDVSRQKEPLATSLDVPAKEIEDVLKKSGEDDSLEANAEEFVGLIYIYAIQHVLMDIRSHILAFTFSYLFLLFALNAYPVAPHHSIMIMLIGLFAAFVVVVVTVFSQMHRDAILSRTTSTEPGKLDFGFYRKLISVLGVPIIGLIASQFPEISNFLFSWLEPSLQTLK